MEKIPGVTYMVALPGDTLCWLSEPATMEKTYRYGGEERTKRVIVEGGTDPDFF